MMNINEDNKGKSIEEEEENYSISNDDDEYERLICVEDRIKDKEGLIEVIDRLKRQLEEKEHNSNLSSNEKEIYKKKKRNKIKPHNKYISFIIFLLFSIFYSVGIFMIIPIKDSLLNLLFTAFKCKLDINCSKNSFYEQTNFFNYFLSQ